MKKTIAIITAIIALAILNASCSRDATESPKATANAPDISNQETINPSDVFAVSRKGQVVTVKLLADLSAYNEVKVLRNTISKLPRHDTVALLGGKMQSHDDIVPNNRAFWYWIRVRLQTGKLVHIGPLQAGADENKEGNYVKVEDVYKFHVQRNANSARIGWDIPDKDLAQVSILRSTNMLAPRRPEVGMSRDEKGHLDDTLPDPNADYWYWLEIMLQNGAIINQPSKKAEIKND